MSDKSRSDELTQNLKRNAASREVIIEFVDCFNRGQYFEAHEVLEKLWLPQRREPNGPFFKGLIQLAGAFVHIQKGRGVPAVALFKLATSNLAEYPENHLQIPVAVVRGIIADWLGKLGRDTEVARLSLPQEAPVLRFVDGGGSRSS